MSPVSAIGEAPSNPVEVPLPAALDPLDLMTLRCHMERKARFALVVEVARRDAAAAEAEERAYVAGMAARYSINLDADSVDSETGTINRGAIKR